MEILSVHHSENFKRHHINPSITYGLLDKILFSGLYTLTTGKKTSWNNYRLFSSFVDLTLHQTGGGYDALADQRTLQDSSFAHVSNVYWPKQEQEAYKNFLKTLKDIYPKDTQERTAILESIKQWMTAFHYWEATIRSIPIPKQPRMQNMQIHRRDTQTYREETNKQYSLSLCTILDPLNKENKALNESIFYPVLMMYQTATDFGQIDLPSQKAKPTMNKIQQRILDPLYRRQLSIVMEEFLRCADQYVAQINLLEHPSKTKAIQGISKALVLAYFLYNYSRYSLLKDKTGRFSVPTATS